MKKKTMCGNCEAIDNIQDVTPSTKHTKHTKQTTGCPRWDWGASDTLILPYTFSPSFQLANRQSAACSCCQ